MAGVALLPGLSHIQVSLVLIGLEERRINSHWGTSQGPQYASKATQGMQIGLYLLPKLYVPKLKVCEAESVT